MSDINKCFFSGRIGADIELKTTHSGQFVAAFPLAVKRRKAAGETETLTDWIDITAFGKTAEYCANYLKKGQFVAVECVLRTRAWEDNDGKKRKGIDFVANEISASWAKIDNAGGKAEGISGGQSVGKLDAAGTLMTPPGFSDDDLPF